ncbi:putative RNA-directed DNA polymerase, eukaryota, reverse transcriptase zinc-binding domain protein [Tanacetum coccineum]
MKMNIFEFVNSFFASGSMPQGANSSFFTLIPKISNPISIKDCRPILLIGTHYKIIAKILANRLSKVADKVVSKEQSAFILGRHILDSPLIISEIIQCLGFGSKWRSWIRACLHSSRASILINGSPTSKFSIKRGLRQGDPLSPFLFILVMEGLHCAMSNAVNSGLIRGINLSSSGQTNSRIARVRLVRGVVQTLLMEIASIVGNTPHDLQDNSCVALCSYCRGSHEDYCCTQLWCENGYPICETCGGYHMDHECFNLQNDEFEEELKAQRIKDQEFLDTFKELCDSVIKKQREERERIAKEKEAEELEALRLLSSHTATKIN